MKHLILLLLFAFSKNAISLTIEPPKKPPTEGVCPSTVDLKLVEAPIPVVHVSPKFPTGTREQWGCVVVSFALAEKPKTDGEALVPDKIKIEASTSKRFERSSIKAVKKWLYLSRNIDKEKRYYTALKYQLE